MDFTFWINFRDSLSVPLSDLYTIVDVEDVVFLILKYFEFFLT